MRKNFLSIDFDYFQKVSKEIIKIYPDGIDAPTDISIKIWSELYRNKSIKDKICSIDIYSDEFDILIEILKKQKSDIPIMIAQSHVDAYDFIDDVFSYNDYLKIINVDLHHDLFNDNETLDCGNWLGKVTEEREGKIEIQWISNPISFDVYGLTGADIYESIKYTSLLNISDMTFDGIFLCRSDMFIPPHLDIYFQKFVSSIRSIFTNIAIEDSVINPRKMPSEINKTNDYNLI